MQRFFKLETVNRYTPLGLRFLDLVRGVSVSDGLVVTARHVGAANPKQLALRSPFSGIYGFHTLPGLRRFEVGEQPATDWCASPPEVGEPTAEELTDIDKLRNLLSASESQQQRANFIISVKDQMERFLPQVLLMCLPRERLVEIPLFSSPARLAPAGLGVVRGELALHDTNSSAPVRWALVTAILDNHTYVGVSDARGMFTLFIPYASTLPPVTPSSGAAISVDQLTWQIKIQVFYEPTKQYFVSDFEPPDMLSIMEQSNANLYSQENQSPAPTLSYLMRFGADLVIKTPQKSQLLIDPAS